MAGTDLFDLAAKISADTASVDAKLTATQKRVLDLAKEFKATDATINSATRSMSAGVANASAQANKFSNSTLAMRAAVRAFGAEAASVAPGPLGNMARQLSYVASSGGAVEGAFGGMLGPIALVAGSMAVAGGMAVGLGVAIFDLTQKAAKAGNEIFSMQEKTNLSARTLSALQILAEQSNTSIERLTAGLGIFDKKIEEAAQNTKSKMAHELRQLGITSHETEGALRQGLETLSKMTNSTQQVAVAMQLFGRSGKEVLAVLKNSDGDFNATIRQLEAMGLILSDADTAGAHEFQQSMVLLEHQLTVTGIKIANELYPTIEGFLTSLNTWLNENRATFETWGRGIANVIEGIKTKWDELAITLANPIIGQVYIVAKWLGFGGGSNAGPMKTKVNVPGVGDVDVPEGADPSQVYQQAASGAGTSPGQLATSYEGSPRQRIGGAGGKGKHGGGGDPAQIAKRLADLRLKAVLDELKAEEDANKHSLDRQWQDFNQYASRFNSTEERRHAAVVSGLAEEMAAAEKIKKSGQQQIAVQEIKNKQAQEEITHEKNRQKVNDERAKLLDQMNDFIAQQVREINYARAGTDQYDKAITELEVQLRKAGVTEVDYKIALMRTNAETQRAIDLVKTLTRERRAIAERQRFADPANLAHSVGIELDETGATRDRRALKMPSWLYNLLPGGDVDQKLHQLAGDITNTLSNAIHAGFDQGIKEGFRSMALGFLQMLEKMGEEWLASSIFRMLQDVFKPSGSSGGGFWSKLLGSILGGAAGGIGGGGGGSHSALISTGSAGKYAMGLDYVPYDNFPAILHKGERVMTAAENRGGGQIHNHYWNITTQDARSFMSEDTQRQMTQRATRIMQHAALTG